MTEDEYGALILRPLAGEPTTPPRIDVAKAMREGRRQRRRRWWTGLSGFAAVTGTLVTGGVLLAPVSTPDPRPAPPLPADPPLPTSCTGSRLPDNGHRVVSVTGGDNSGRWLAGTGSPTTLRNDRLLVWRDGRLVADLPALADDFAPTDVNRSGVAVGSGWFYRDGRIARLPGDGTVRGIAINDAGTVAGEVVRNGLSVPAVWASTADEPRLLPVPPETSGDTLIRDIDDAGTVVGVIGYGAYLWQPDGAVREIPLPDLGGSPHFDVAAMRNGWIYGDLTGPQGTVPHRYDPLSGTWQQLDRGPGVYGDSTQDIQAQSNVRVNRTVLKLPRDPASAAEKRGGYLIRTVSDDARVIAGDVLGAQGAETDVKPVIWRCR